MLVLVGGGSGELPAGRAGVAVRSDTDGLVVHFEESVEDGAPVEEVAFYRVLTRAAELSDAAWGQPAQVVTAAELTASPHLYRGRMVEVAGAVAETSPWELPGNPSGLGQLFRVFLVDETDHLTAAAVLRDPGRWDQGDGARLRGIFFKIWRYRNRARGWEEAPLLVARELVSAPVTSGGGRGAEGLVTLAVAAGAALVLLLLLRSWTAMSRAPVRFRMPDRGRTDGDGTGPRRSG